MTSIYYKIKHDNCKNFKKNDIVILICNSCSGNCYLVADTNNLKNREWIMNYDLEEIKN